MGVTHPGNVVWQQPLNRLHLSNKNLKGLWLFGPKATGFGTNTVFDISGRNHNMTLNNIEYSADWQSASAKGDFGSIFLDGSDESGQIAHHEDFNVGTSDFQIGMRCRLANSSAVRHIYAKTQSAFPNPGITIFQGSIDAFTTISASKRIGFIIFESSVGDYYFKNTSVDIVDGNWHDIVIERKEGVVSLIIDGINRALTGGGSSGTGQGSNPNNSSIITIGRSAGNPSGFGQVEVSSCWWHTGYSPDVKTRYTEALKGYPYLLNRKESFALFTTPQQVSKFVSHAVLGASSGQYLDKFISHAVLLSPVASSVQISKLVAHAVLEPPVTLINNSFDLFLRGPAVPVSGVVDLYTLGHRENETALNLFLNAGDLTAASGQLDLYVNGLASGVNNINNNFDMYTIGSPMENSYLNMFLNSSPTTYDTDGSLNLYLFNQPYSINKSLDLSLSGALGSGTYLYNTFLLYIKGDGILDGYTPSNGSMNLFMAVSPGANNSFDMSIPNVIGQINNNMDLYTFGIQGIGSGVLNMFIPGIATFNSNILHLFTRGYSGHY